MVILDFGTLQLAANGDERNIAFRTFEDGAVLAHDSTVVSVQVGGYIAFGELVTQRLPNETVNPLDGEMHAEEERLSVNGIQASLHHLLGKSLNEGVCYCCHFLVSFLLIIMDARKVL